MTFGTYLASKRADAGFTLQTLGNRADLSAQYLNDLEHDRRTPSQPVLFRLATVFAVDPVVMILRLGQMPQSIAEALEHMDDAAIMRLYAAMHTALLAEGLSFTVEIPLPNGVTLDDGPFDILGQVELRVPDEGESAGGDDEG